MVSSQYGRSHLTTTPQPMRTSLVLNPGTGSSPTRIGKLPQAMTKLLTFPVSDSSSEYSADYELDEEANLRCVSEALTNHLAFMTDRYALYCLRQDNSNAEIRARLDPFRYIADIGSATVTSWDDGGLARFGRQPDTWRMENPSSTIRESKIASTNVAHDLATGRRNQPCHHKREHGPISA